MFAGRYGWTDKFISGISLPQALQSSRSGTLLENGLPTSRLKCKVMDVRVSSMREDSTYCEINRWIGAMIASSVLDCRWESSSVSVFVLIQICGQEFLVITKTEISDTGNQNTYFARCLCSPLETWSVVQTF